MWFRKITNKHNLADRILDQAFDSERRSAHPEIPLVYMRARVESRLADKQEEMSIMARLISLMTMRRRLATGIGIAIAVVLFVTLVPLPYSVMSGYKVNIAASPLAVIDPTQYVNVLNKLGISTASINVQASSDATTVTIDGLKTKDDARKAIAAFTPLTGVVPKASIEAVKTPVSGTLFAQALQKIFRAEIQISGKSDAEIEAEVTRQVQAQGGTVNSVQVQRSADGQTSVTIDASSGN